MHLNKTINQFYHLYDCKIKTIGRQVINKASLLYGSPEISDSEFQNVISIEMPEQEFQKFCNNWDQYMIILQASKNNPIVKAELEKLVTYSKLTS